MPYMQAPPRLAAAWDYALRAGMYVMTLIMGVGAVVWTPATIDARMPAVVTVAWGWLAILGSLLCLWGCTRRVYPPELIGLPLVVGAVIVYAITIASIIPDSPTRLAQYGAVSALAWGLGTRWNHLRAIRWRRRHEADLARAATVRRALGDTE